MDAPPDHRSAARLPALDVVRGGAMLGILAANIVAFGQPMVAYGWPGGFLVSPGPLGDWLWGGQLVLVDGKFRGLFTLLFGAGMVLFLAGAQRRGRGHGLLAWRLGWLGLFGFLHWALLWRGDILMTYAVAGLVLLPFAGWHWTRQLALGLAGYVAGAIASFASSVPLAAIARGSYPPGSTLAAYQAALAEAHGAAIADARVETALIRAGDQAGMVHHALSTHLRELPVDMLPTLFETVPLMLIGMAAMGMGLFEGRLPARRQARWGWWLWLGGTAASLPIAAWAMGRGIDYWGAFAALNGLLPLPQLASALGLLCLLALWGRRARGPLARLLGDAGRCAFSNYIGTSALALAVFGGWGLDLFGRLGRLELYGVMAVFWLLMLAWPAWWLRRFRHGPLEWAWRCLTYGQRMPLRR